MSKIEDGNGEYWIKRIIARDKAAKLSEDKLLKHLYNAYSDSYITIQKELNDFYMKYATENGLSYSDVVKKLKPTDMREYNSKMNQLKRLYKATKNEDIFMEMQRLGARGNITRLQALLDSIDIELIKNSYKAQIKIEEHLSDMYKRSYKEALEEVGMINKVINNRAVKEALTYPWSGKNFSNRIWDLKKTTLNKFQDTITKGIIQGKSIQDMAGNIRDLSTQTYKKNMEQWQIEKAYRYNSERLVRTETNYFMTRGHIEGYKESGIIEALQIDEYIDGRTCSACKNKDGTIVKLSEVIYGDNVPPFHPGCRGTVIPIIEE